LLYFFKDNNMSASNYLNISNSKPAQPVSHGQGQAGLISAVTSSNPKATATISPAITVATHNGGFVPHTVIAAGNFDRTVATSLGK
jgi:hypothetical protein